MRLYRNSVERGKGKIEKEIIYRPSPCAEKTRYAEENNRYFDFKHLKICAYFNIFL